jgi:N-acyl-D-amino-acid deacylase
MSSRSACRRATTVLTLIVTAIVARTARADEPAVPAAQSDRITAALKLGVPLVEKAAGRYPEHRKCFSCHHQTLPMLAVISARAAGVAGDEATLTSQADFTHKSFATELDDLRAGKGIGGAALTVSYALWTLSLVDRPADETTAAMIAYLLKTQQDDGRWKVQVSRPPMEDSEHTPTALAIVGLKKYGPTEAGEVKDQVTAALDKARSWLAANAGETTEDKAARLWGLHAAGAPEAEVSAARSTLLSAQRADGGWSQLDTMESDAYATGQVLSVLLSTGHDRQSPEVQRGVEHLLSTQLPDGSWHVKTRAKPVQVYFDNEDPHGRDQFISTPATCWALTALGLVARQ